MKKSLVFLMAMVLSFSLASSAFAMNFEGTDELEDMIYIWQRANENSSIDRVPSANQKYFSNYTGMMRGAFQADQPDWIAYQVNGGSTARVVTNYWPNEVPQGDADHFVFFSSADGEQWSALNASVTVERRVLADLAADADTNDPDNQMWAEVIYSVSAVPNDHMYLKIQWPTNEGTLTQGWGQRIEKVTVSSAGAPAGGSSSEAPAAGSSSEAPAAGSSSEAPAANPKTSDAGVAQYIILAVLAASALLLLQRKKANGASLS